MLVEYVFDIVFVCKNINSRIIYEYLRDSDENIVKYITLKACDKDDFDDLVYDKFFKRIEKYLYGLRDNYNKFIKDCNEFIDFVKVAKIAKSQKSYYKSLLMSNHLAEEDRKGFLRFINYPVGELEEIKYHEFVINLDKYF